MEGMLGKRILDASLRRLHADYIDLSHPYGYDADQPMNEILKVPADCRNDSQ
jgi:aryl-alcohol dehydrogenase-like predicted oxidoreductase